MEILDLRHLRSCDLESLLEEESALWRQQLKWDYTSSVTLIKRYVDACALPGYAAIDGGRAVGFSFYVYENQKGVVGDVFVSGSVNGDTEAELLKHIIETLQATPGVRRMEAQLMSLRRLPTPEFFCKQNVRGYLRRFMALNIPAASGESAFEDASRIKRRCPPLLEIEPWGDQWTDAAAQLIATAYQGHVDSDINDQYRSRAGAVRFLENIIHYPGCGEFDSASSYVAVCSRSGALNGIILCSVVGERVAHITQVCVRPELHGKGIGSALIDYSTARLSERNFDAITLTVTDANHRAVRLYEDMGFSTLKEFYAFSWDSPQPRDA